MKALDSSIGLDPQALFYVLGIEQCERRILRSDRYVALRIPRDFMRYAAEFLGRERPKRFIPKRPSLGAMRRFLNSELREVPPDIYNVVEQAQLYLRTLAPKELTDEQFPVEYVPHSLQLTTLRRSFAVLHRPWTLQNLLGIGGLMADEARALMEVIPDLYREFLLAVVTVAMDERGRKRTWQPARMAKGQMPVLIGAQHVSIPEVADLFAAKRQQRASPGGGQTPDLESTRPQRQANDLPSPKELAR